MIGSIGSARINCVVLPKINGLTLFCLCVKKFEA